MSTDGTIECFLLTRQWRDESNGLTLTFWGASSRGPVRISVTGEEAVCFVARETVSDGHLLRNERIKHKPLQLVSLAGDDVDGLYFRYQRDLIAARDLLKSRGAIVFESDIKPNDRYLMERYVTASFAARGQVRQRDNFIELVNPAIKSIEFRTELSWVSLDIETEGLDGMLYSIAVVTRDEARVFMVADSPVLCDEAEVIACPDEAALLKGFFTWLHETDPDLIIGWNVAGFDLRFIEEKCQRVGIPFAVGRGRERSTILQPSNAAGTHVARVPGRVVLDGIELLRAGFWTFDSFELETVAQALLGRGKRIQSVDDKLAEIKRLFAEDKTSLATYNIEDCRLVVEIFEKANLVEFAMRRAELTGLALDRQGGSVASFDNLYLPRLHRRGRVAPDVMDVREGPPSPGGYVMDSKPGLYENVLLFDFKSLYPSIIRTFMVDPLGLVEPGADPVPGFLEAKFARENAILPALIQELWTARDDAKRRADAPMSQAVKILMNSFYGVLGSTGCRFYDARLASSITRRGHEIIRSTRDFIEKAGYTVVYGDTDSVFVLLGSGSVGKESEVLGKNLAAQLNDWWTDKLRKEFQLPSFLEVEFETHFKKFLMPTVRGEHTGSKKRYAGLVTLPDGGHELVFKGLETVRTDWTPLARRFQRALYERVFLNEPYVEFVRETLSALLNGDLDTELVYRKRLRRPLHEYTKNVPPHVQAARKRKNSTSRWIHYVITTRGPEPVVDTVPRPDYEHYRDRQLAPAADTILHFLDTSFAEITDAQLAIF